MPIENLDTYTAAAFYPLPDAPGTNDAGIGGENHVVRIYFKTRKESPLAPNNGGIGRIKSAPAPPLLGAGGVLKYIIKNHVINDTVLYNMVRVKIT